MSIFETIVLSGLAIVTLISGFSVYIAMYDKEKMYPKWMTWNWTLIGLLYLAFAIIVFIITGN